MLSQVEVTTVDFARSLPRKPWNLQKCIFIKQTMNIPCSRRNCAEYEDMEGYILSTAEKNVEIAKYYNDLAERRNNRRC